MYSVAKSLNSRTGLGAAASTVVDRVVRARFPAPQVHSGIAARLHADHPAFGRRRRRRWEPMLRWKVFFPVERQGRHAPTMPHNSESSQRWKR
jgi:hypothetical protein